MRTSILVAEGDPDFAEVIIETFSSNEYNVRAVSNVEDALAEIEKEAPDVVLISDDLSKGRTEQLSRMLHEKRGTAEVPALILLTGESNLHQVLSFNTWVDASLRRPVDPVVLESTVESMIQRRKKSPHSNPLTKLPDAAALSKEIDKRAANGESLCMRTFRFDTSQAAAYRRKYGEIKYLTMVRLAAHAVANCALTYGGREAFVAHRGTTEEPEFVVLIDGRKIEEFERATCEEFATNSELLYDKKDRMEGYLIERDEEGNKKAVPLISLVAEPAGEEKVAHPHE